MEELSRDFPAAPIVLAGDLNQLSDEDIVERTGLTQIVHQPTRGANILDRVLISDPQLYTTVRVVASVVKSDHKAVVVYACDVYVGGKVRVSEFMRFFYLEDRESK